MMIFEVMASSEILSAVCCAFARRNMCTDCMVRWEEGKASLASSLAGRLDTVI